MKHMVQAVTRSLRSRDRYSYVREKFMSGRKPFPTMAQTLEVLRGNLSIRFLKRTFARGWSLFEMRG